MLPKQKIAVYLILLIPPLAWAGNFVVGRFIYAEVPAGTLNFLRWLIALFVLMPIVLVRGEWQLNVMVKHWKYLSLVALTGVTLFHTLIYTGLNTVPVANVGILVTAVPVVILILTLVQGKEKFSLPGLIGLLIASIGAIVVLTRGDLESLLSLRLGNGEWLVLLAVPCWAIYTVAIKQKPEALSSLMLLTGMTIYGLLFQAPLAISEFISGYRLTLTNDIFISVMYLGLFPSVLAYICWNFGVAEIGANRTGYFMYLMPILSALLAVYFLDEQFALFHIVGAVMVITGILLAQLSSNKSA